MMKIYLLLCFMLLPMQLLSQELYTRFLEEGKTWEYHYYNDFTGKEHYKALSLIGDTIINDIHYKKIVDLSDGKCIYAMREDKKKIYLKYFGVAETLIYDFGLQVGDRFPMYESNESNQDNNDYATVFSVDTIRVDHYKFRVIDIRSKDMAEWPNIWIEGVGSLTLLTSNFLVAGNDYTLSKCILPDGTVFDYKTFYSILKINDRIDLKDKLSQLFDLQGHRVTTDKPKPGIYVREGRKFVVK